MAKKVLILGAGRVGTAIALDLASTYQVMVVDKNDDTLLRMSKAGIPAINGNGSDARTIEAIAWADLVVNAVPGDAGFQILRRVIEAGKDVVDISFAPENPFDLNPLAQEKGVKAVVDCGIAPGLSNMIAGYHFARMDVEEFTCYVGGLPKKRDGVFDYRAPFSPRDVLAEYLRPARFIENGEMVTKEALSDIEELDFDGIGTLEAFNTDGLRTLLQTLKKIPDMKEKTLRYPGHAKQMKFLRDVGLLSQKSITVAPANVAPFDVTTKLLLPHWELGPGEEEFTIMRVIVRGKELQRKTTYTYTVFDQYDAETKLTSMARTTGYTATAVARLMLGGWMKKKTGIIAPEEIPMGQNGEFCFKTVLDDLKKRNIKISTAKTVVD